MINKDCIFPQVPLRTLNRTLESEDEGVRLHWNALEETQSSSLVLSCCASVFGPKPRLFVLLCACVNHLLIFKQSVHDLLLKESNHVNLRGVERVYTNQSSLVKAVIRYSTLCLIRSLHENTRTHLYKTYFCKGRRYFVKTEIKINIIFENCLWLCPASYFWVWYCM